MVYSEDMGSKNTFQIPKQVFELNRLSEVRSSGCFLIVFLYTLPMDGVDFVYANNMLIVERTMLGIRSVETVLAELRHANFIRNETRMIDGKERRGYRLRYGSDGSVGW